MSFFSSDMFTFVVVPLMIFSARIFDVSIGTVKYIFITRGFKNIAPVLGFFEVIIWLIAIGQVMNNITNPICYIAYGGGFGTGTYIGMVIEERMKLGLCIIRFITARPAQDFVDKVRNEGYGVTNISAQGIKGEVSVIFMVVKRTRLAHLMGMIREFNPDAFFTIEDVRSASEGIFPSEPNIYPFSYFKRPFSMFSKRK